MENNNSFYIRQFSHLLSDGESVTQALNKIISCIPPNESESWHQVRQEYERTRSLSSALSVLNDRESNLLLMDLKRGHELGISEEELLTSSVEERSTSTQLNTIIKSRLLKSMSYAALLSLMALVILGIFYFYSLPNFTAMFDYLFEYDSPLKANIDALTFQSWFSLLIYLPPVLIISLFIAIKLTNIDTILDGKVLSRLPLIKSMQRDIARTQFVKRLCCYQDYLSKNEAEFMEQVNSAFFTGSENLKINRLFSNKEIKHFTTLNTLGTLSFESGNLITDIETSSIESISNKANGLAVAFQISIILIVGVIVTSLYLPIFKMGSAI